MPDNAVLVVLSADIVSAFVAHNHLPIAELAELITSTHAALSGLGKEVAEPESAKRVPVVSVKKSITADYLVCLEDGKRFKTLKRHLRNAYNITPEEYRARWNLPDDYPMVAPNYAEQRSQIAKRLGLGQGQRKLAAKRKVKVA